MFIQRSNGAFFRIRRRVADDQTSVYHVVNRLVRKQFWLGEEEREMFCRILRKQAAFAGIEVLAHCVMSNHFHLLLRVPEKPLKSPGKHLLDDTEILRRYEAFYGEEVPRSTFSVTELKAAFAEGGEIAEHARQIVLARMGNISAFMKELKQRFGIWFNDQHDNGGTIWSERFKSILVENDAAVMSHVAAYIDLNPVRAGMVVDPKDYRWSSFGQAMKGSPDARSGLCALFDRGLDEFSDVVKQYQSFLYPAKTEGIEGNRSHSRDANATSGEVAKVSVAEALRTRILEFSQTTAVGSEAFLSECKQLFNPKTKALPRNWLGWQRFCSKLRDSKSDQ